MAKLFTLAEIEQQFADEWILVGEPQTDPDLQVERGVVLFHSPDRDADYHEAIRLRPRRSALLFTGAQPADTEIVLSLPRKYRRDG